MPMSRRELVTIGGTLGGAALLAVEVEGQVQNEEGVPQAPVARTAERREARGRVTSYGEEATSASFTLSEMPEGIESFYTHQGMSDRIGRVVLAAAMKGWEVHVTYRFAEGIERGLVDAARIEGIGA